MVLKIIVGIIIALYPLAVYFGLQVFEVKTLGLLLLGVLVLRMFASKASMSGQLILMTAGGCLLASAIVFTNETLYLKLYPVLMNGLMFAVFISTLLWPPSMIERLARLKEPDLEDDAIEYTKKVTVLWCVFFVLNGSIALWTVVEGSMEQWTLYNGLIAYLLMGTLMGAELCVRFWVKRSKGAVDV
ncbi:hypothetical protein A9Q99_16070 [Gammaproteobacteria bacterium 45_16_T64]|nr:hypothetical protein A9Q99_16070 [Gammaproteobacteria bacterium 45_16_T64]